MPISGLEAAEEQLKILFTMGEGDEDAFVAQALEDMETVESNLDELIAAWRTGDERTLDRLVVADMRERYPAVYRALLINRNRAWLPRVEALFESPETELVLVGAAHLVGPDGLLAQLTGRGYRVRRWPGP